MSKGFYKFGSWGKLKKASTSLANDIREAEELALQRIALQAEATAKRYILSQPASWKPLNIAYKRKKAGRSRTRIDGGQDRRFKPKSTKILIATSAYLQGITSKIDKRKLIAYAGVTKNKLHKPSKMPLVNIAKVHEFGSRDGRIPARPVWRPTTVLVKAWVKDSRVLQQELQKQFRKYY